eukprot:765518-Hanusia_phi.AAC.17
MQNHEGLGRGMMMAVKRRGEEPGLQAEDSFLRSGSRDLEMKQSRAISRSPAADAAQRELVKHDVHRIDINHAAVDFVGIMSDYGGGDHGSGGNQDYQSGQDYQQGQEGQGVAAAADYSSGYAMGGEYPGGMREDMGMPGSNEPVGFKLFVGGIPWKYSDEDLRDHFAQCGNVVSANVIVEKVGEHAGRSRGFGFVVFERKEDSEDAIRNLHESEIEGRKVSECEVASW